MDGKLVLEALLIYKNKLKENFSKSSFILVFCVACFTFLNIFDVWLMIGFRKPCISYI
ncbi:hypothetical protein J569_0517 [Acinetobacter sp. 907131]|jgi:hypothetical protein|nr:hypothetical protein J569_0517 [Acinetobacter sp. 907131]EXS17190.1 hypothetical protein J672_0952 [Acinetobacter sp. 883425]